MPEYIVRFDPKPHAHSRLFCFPYAGATAAYYRTWAPLVASDTELIAVEIPGRLHLRDTPARDMAELVEILLPHFLPLQNIPFVFYGHSYGSTIAYELAKRLKPMALFVSSRRAPQLPSLFPRASILPDKEFIDAMQNMYHAIPAAILQEKELLQLLLPILKDDMRMNETYIGTLSPLLEIPVVAMYGKEDNTINPNEIQAWKEVTKGPFTEQGFDGGHFFIDQHKGAILAQISKIWSK